MTVIAENVPLLEGKPFAAFLTDHVARVAPLMRDASLAAWEMQTTSSPEARDRSEKLNAELLKVYADADAFDYLKQLPASELPDPLSKRQHELLLNAYLGSQMPPDVIEQMVGLEIEIEDLFNQHRAIVGGEAVSDNALDDILLTSGDVALRQEAWEASKTVGAIVEPKLLELVRLRNREAQRLGFRDYYALSLQLQEVDETRLFALLDDLAAQSEPIWNQYRDALDAELAAQFQTGPDAIRPWHHANRFFQEPGQGEANLDRFFADKDLAATTQNFFAAIGLPVDDLLTKADLYERPGKCQHAFCMDIDRQGDVRVLCNNRPTARWMGTMLHEFGHAVYDKFLDPELPFLLREPAHTMTTEAIALFMGRLDRDARWLQTYAGVEPDEASRISGLARREVRDHLLVFMRWCLVMAHFERELYKNPDQNLNTVWYDLVEKYQRLAKLDGRDAPDWAAKIHLATAPVYYHNYQLGEMIASQLLHTLQTSVLAGEPADALIASPKVGAWMQTQLFTPGAIRDWEGWLQHATGESLNPAYFVRQLQAE